MTAPSNVTARICARAREAPDLPAVLTKDGTLTFAELERAVSWTAAGFATAGLAPGDIAALRLPHQTQHLIASLALARLGVGQLAFDASDPPLLQKNQAERLGVAVTISAEPTGVAPGTSHLAAPPASVQDLKGLPGTAAPLARDGSLPFMVLRSSGTTTGVVKLSILTHALGRARFPSHRAELPNGPGHRYLALVDLSFVSVKQRFFAGLDAGTCLVPFDGLESIDACLAFVLGQRIDYISGTPLHADRLLTKAGDDRLLLPELAALRLGLTVIPDVLRERIRAHLTPNLFVAYGSNEIGTIATATPDMVARIPGSVGFPVAGVETAFLDDRGRPRETSSGSGRLLVRSPGMITRYHDAPPDQSPTFVDGWFDTGDHVAFSEQGVLIHHGRADDVMIFDGINIYPAEIENALLQHPAVREAAAFPVDSLAHGKRPFAAVVATPGATEMDLLAHCKAWLGNRSPHGVLMFSALPRNAVGKVIKRELAERVQRILHRRENAKSD